MPKVHITISIDLELQEILKENVSNVSEWVSGQVAKEFSKTPPKKAPKGVKKEYTKEEIASMSNVERRGV